RAALRACCRAARGIVDHSLLKVGFCYYDAAPEFHGSLSPAEIGRTVKGMLLRGCRPPWLQVATPCFQDIAHHERLVLQTLRSWAAAGSISSIHLDCYIALTPDITSAIAAFSPNLNNLSLWCGPFSEEESSHELAPMATVQAQPEDIEAAGAQAQRLLGLTGSTLAKLEIQLSYNSEHIWPQRALCG
ncbi:hypothetical protein Agub_g13671, partial [Astrephomene gubernaculifera]